MGDDIVRDIFNRLSGEPGVVVSANRLLDLERDVRQAWGGESTYVLKKVRWNRDAGKVGLLVASKGVTAAAEVEGVSRSTIYRILRRKK